MRHKRKPSKNVDIIENYKSFEQQNFSNCRAKRKSLGTSASLNWGHQSAYCWDHFLATTTETEASSDCGKYLGQGPKSVPI